MLGNKLTPLRYSLRNPWSLTDTYWLVLEGPGVLWNPPYYQAVGVGGDSVCQVQGHTGQP